MRHVGKSTWENSGIQGRTRTKYSQQQLYSNCLLYSPIFFLPNTQKSKPCLCMQIDKQSLGDGWCYQQSERRIIMKTSLLHRSSQMEITWSLLIKYCVYLLLLFWKTTICCKSLSQHRGMPRHTDMHTLCLPSWLLNRIKDITMQTHLSVAGLFFFVYPSIQDKKRARVRVTAISEHPHPSPDFFC